MRENEREVEEDRVESTKFINAPHPRESFGKLVGQVLSRIFGAPDRAFINNMTIRAHNSQCQHLHQSER